MKVKSLNNLFNKYVISISHQKRRHPHTPYRNSKQKQTIEAETSAHDSTLQIRELHRL